MPFKVRFDIYESGKGAPCYSGHNRELAYIELEDLRNKNGYLKYSMKCDITLADLTKPEKYVWLVYQVRQAINRYYSERKHVTPEQSLENLQASLTLEKQLDDWNTRTRCYINSHPKASHGDEKDFSFFLIVEEWRTLWHKYFAYKKLSNKDQAVQHEMYKQCRDFEKQIDNYVKQVIGL